MKKKTIGSFLALILVFTTISIILAAPNRFTISWWTVDGGGGTSQGGEYAISGSIGQPDAGSTMRGGAYTVEGGFWGGALTPPASNRVYLPLVLK